MDIQEYRDYLDKFLDVRSLSDESITRLYEERQKEKRKYLERQLKKALREGTRIHKNLMKKRFR